MNRIVALVVALALVLGIVWYVKRPGGPSPETAERTGAPTGENGAVPPANETHPAEEGAAPNGAAAQTGGTDAAKNGAGVNGNVAPNEARTDANGKPLPPGSAKTGAAGTSPRNSGVNGATGGTSAGAPGAQTGAAATTGKNAAAPGGETVVSGGKVTPAKPGETEPNDGVDGTGMPSTIGRGGAPAPGAGGPNTDCDDGGCAPTPGAKPSKPVSLAGVRTPKVWLVAADLKKLPGAKGGGALEIGNPEGSKATPWKNREGTKLGDGVRAKGGTTATFVRAVRTTHGTYDAVAICAPSTPGCLNQAPTQIKFGVDLNHPEAWVNGPDHSGKSPKGGSSFTALFVAARASAAGNPLLENQNGEAGAKSGPFLGWVGDDFVGSVHGLQGIVGMNAAAIKSPYAGGVSPAIYAIRYDRKKSELRIFLDSDKGGATAAQPLEKGDGPNNNEYAAIAIGSKNPGRAALTYVLEAAAFGRALTDKEICAIHKEWNKKYSLGVPAGELKPCP